jgi:hypothetical protein
MKTTALAATLGAALLLAGAPVLASAADAQSGPIRLDKVQITQSYGPRDEFAPGLVTVAFTNENDSPATDIIFALVSDGKVIDRYEDVGTYTKGDTVRHSFQDIQDNNNQELAVEQATFADGTVWSNSEIAFEPTLTPPAAAQVSEESLFPYHAY